MSVFSLIGELLVPWVALVISRFILPRQSLCQSIFLKKQGTYLLYAILWLVRPLIKNILDSSPQYLSNFTFTPSLPFQMREEYTFVKKYIFWNRDLKGGKYWHFAISHTIYACFETENKAWIKLFWYCGLSFMDRDLRDKFSCFSPNLRP